MPPGDMIETLADTARALAAFGIEPAATIETGMAPAAEWCHDYFGNNA